MRFALQQASRRGGRENNEDCVGHCLGSRCGVFVLADGMGGHPRGEVASRLAVEATVDLPRGQARPLLADPASFLAAAVAAAHERLRDYALREALDDAPRTTWVACVLQDGAAWWGHCGDSRFYLVRGGAIVRRTRDHSFRERQDGMGLAVAADGRVGRNVLYTCLGGHAVPQAEFGGPLRLEPGDRLLLCSDGLWDNLGDESIAAQLAAAPLADAVPALVGRALREGGVQCDNVSVLALEWEPADDAAVARLPAGGRLVRSVGGARSGIGLGVPAPAATAAALARRAFARRGR